MAGILAFLFITDRDFLNTFFKKSSEKKEIVQIEKILESISIEDREAIKVVPSVTIDELNNIITPPASTDKKEVIKKKPFSTEEAKTFKKITYSVHIGAFIIEENAFSLVNKFKQKGYEPFIRKVLRNNNETIHRVLIGNFEDKDKALEQSKIIRQKEGLNSFVYNY